jgi:tRNA (guanine37-N1)-methyltransferase
MSPRGVLLKQDMAVEIIGRADQVKKIAILCGRFEGVDQRVIKYYNIEEISIGDFVISGGELAAMTFVDCLVRLLDGFASSKESIFEDSFSGSLQGLLEYPLYTKPVSWQGLSVPEVLLSGNHASINAWKLENAKSTTCSRRPDLWQLYADKSK